MVENEYDAGGAVRNGMSKGVNIRFGSSGGMSAFGMKKLSVLHALLQSWQGALLRRVLHNQHQYSHSVCVCVSADV